MDRDAIKGIGVRLKRKAVDAGKKFLVATALSALTMLGNLALDTVMDIKQISSENKSE